VTGLSKRIAVALSLVCLFAGVSRAGTITIADTQLISSNVYYTDLIGGGIGSPLVMTGGGANANVGFSPNDDGFSGPIPLGFDLNLFGTDYTQFWANNNGNVSFTGGFDAWLPGGLSVVNVPIIAPFFADVDTTGAGSGLMYFRNDIPNEIIVTWDQVGYYNQETDKLNSFQLVLRGPDFVVPPGEGQVGFFYKTMLWETGDGPGDGGFGLTDGLGATIGFGDGIGNSQVLLESSTRSGIAGIVSDHHAWFDRDVAPGLFAAPVEVQPVPEPVTLLLVGTGAAFLGRKLYSRKRRA
jgi:hypothetical protein